MKEEMKKFEGTSDPESTVDPEITAEAEVNSVSSEVADDIGEGTSDPKITAEAKSVNSKETDASGLSASEARNLSIPKQFKRIIDDVKSAIYWGESDCEVFFGHELYPEVVEMLTKAGYDVIFSTTENGYKLNHISWYNAEEGKEGKVLNIDEPLAMDLEAEDGEDETLEPLTMDSDAEDVEE